MRARIPKAIRKLLAPLSVGVFGVLLTLVLGLNFGIPYDGLTRDIFAIVGVVPIAGILSNFGAFVWCATVTVLGFTLLLVARTATKFVWPFLTSSLLITLWLLFDDFFMFHDFWMSRWLANNEKFYFLVLGLVLVTYLIWFRKTILRSSYMYLLCAFGFLGLSLVADQFSEGVQIASHWFYLVEDGAKFVGICFWCAYYSSYCRCLIRNELANTKRPIEAVK